MKGLDFSIFFGGVVWFLYCGVYEVYFFFCKNWFNWCILDELFVNLCNNNMVCLFFLKKKGFGNFICINLMFFLYI